MFNVLLTLLLMLVVTGTGWGQPVITNQPQTQAVAPGTTATFTMGASGAEPLAFQWQRNLGAGFSDLADCTNAALMLTNVQPWDAWDYRVVVTNLTGSQTSAVAHLYVMSPALLTNRVVLDNFDDNKLTGWTPFFGAELTETNQQLTVRGYWPGWISYDPPDTVANAFLSRTWSVGDGQTLEWRVDLVGMNEHATAAIIELVNSTSDGVYPLFKGRDFIHVNKYFVSRGPAHFAHERALIQNSNVVVAWALTRVMTDLILTARILDKANHNAVLYERSVVDTPNVDRTLAAAEQEAASGMRLKAVSDIQGPPWASGIGVFLDVWQYNFDGKQPAAQVTFDNFELWTYRLPIIRYVDAGSTNATPPYANWFTAATNIQDAVDAALAGDEIVVTNGTYATGGRAVGTNVLVNRVVVDKPLTVRSVNGPQFTVIRGDFGTRCVYLTNGASLSGFTLTNGAADSGGGVWCESTSAVVSNCVLTGNSAFGGFGMRTGGGGASGGTLNNCTLTWNSANGPNANGGGASDSTLNNCTLTGNSSDFYGGGACGGTLNNCTLTGNSANGAGGGANACALNHCIVYFNTAPTGANYHDWIFGGALMNYCCTTPMPTNGVGNITNAPLFVNFAGGNLRLQANSPCINAGLNADAHGPTDLDGNPRIVSGAVDIGAYEFQGTGSVISYAWLQQYGLPTDGSADASDQDADGLNTRQEWRCLTDPTNALSALRLLSATRAGTNVTVSWQSVAGVSYFLEGSTDLSATPSFTLLAPNLSGQAGTTSFTDTNAVGVGPFFYRVGVGF